MKLRTALAERLAEEPETGEGYWIVTVATWDGREIAGIAIIDDEIIAAPPDLQPRDIVAVLVGDLWISAPRGWKGWDRPARSERPRTTQKAGRPAVAPRSVAPMSLPGPTAELDSWASPSAAHPERRGSPSLLAAWARRHAAGG